jgi:hypothetical protein
VLHLNLRQLWNMVQVCGAREVQRIRISITFDRSQTLRVFLWILATPAPYVDYIANRGVD